MNGRARIVKNAEVTLKRVRIPAVAFVQRKEMKDAWCLATSRVDLSSEEVIR
jgi:hypothetical protein